MRIKDSAPGRPPSPLVSLPNPVNGRVAPTPPSAPASVDLSDAAKLSASRQPPSSGVVLVSNANAAEEAKLAFEASVRAASQAAAEIRENPQVATAVHAADLARMVGSLRFT